MYVFWIAEYESYVNNLKIQNSGSNILDQTFLFVLFIYFLFNKMTQLDRFWPLGKGNNNNISSTISNFTVICLISFKL